MADPVDALWIETVHRLVEHDRLRIAEQRGRDPEALSHAERELARSLASDLVEADEVDQLADPAAWDPVGLRECEQMVVGRAACVDRPGFEERADLVERRGALAVALSVHGDRAGGRRVEPEDQAHRRRLARA